MRLQAWRPPGLMLFDRHLRRPFQQILAEILQNLPRSQEQAVALLGFDGQRYQGWLIWIRNELISSDRIGGQFLFLSHQVCSRARFTSGGVASSTSAASASFVGIT